MSYCCVRLCYSTVLYFVACSCVGFVRVLLRVGFALRFVVLCYVLFLTQHGVAHSCLEVYSCVVSYTVVSCCFAVYRCDVSCVVALRPVVLCYVIMNYSIMNTRVVSCTLVWRSTAVTCRALWRRRVFLGLCLVGVSSSQWFPGDLQTVPVQNPLPAEMLHGDAHTEPN